MQSLPASPPKPPPALVLRGHSPTPSPGCKSASARVLRYRGVVGDAPVLSLPQEEGGSIFLHDAALNLAASISPLVLPTRWWPGTLVNVGLQHNRSAAK